ncbi:MAG: S46 family peptidase [Ignavibacteriales bacterium]|nr:S46 family peptidase [Ignavibacteriales bacterium]
MLKIKVQYFHLFFIFTFFSIVNIYSQISIYEPLNIDTVSSSLTDLGRMWTFDNIPFNYFESEYGFQPSEEWLEHIQKSALEFGGGCSAAFVSADGLIMTNHHCGRGQLIDVQKEGENLLRDGFYASTLEEERKIPKLTVDQLITIEDVSQEIFDEMNKGNNDDEKVQLCNKKIKELEEQYSKETSLLCSVIPLYNGGKYSMYCYKRFDDVRLVMSPDFQIAATGWDWDNFTYPRYELDFAFYRAYENGEPIKTEHYFKWSEKGAVEDELIFVVGRPGNTDRLLSVAQLEFMRDYIIPYQLILFNGLYDAYFYMFENHPERESELLNSVLGWGNARKSYAGRLVGLKDEYIMKKKKDFEEKLIEYVNTDPELKEQYGDVWNNLKTVFEEAKKYHKENIAYRLPRYSLPIYFTIANKVIEYAEQMKLPESSRKAAYQIEQIEKTKTDLCSNKFEYELQDRILLAYVKYIVSCLGVEHNLVKDIFNGKTGNDAVNYLLENSSLTSNEKIKTFIESTPDEILNSKDPFISYILKTRNKGNELKTKMDEIYNTVSVLNQLLGQIAYKVYGDKISPDATGSIRLQDGVIKGYEYNGTIAPSKCTFYGLYDRYYSFGGKTYPWGLHERWQVPPPELDLSIPVGFASTNDIVGGNSGSSVINTKGEIVGLVHDGNMESLPGYFIFLPINNRTVATDSWGLMEALKYIYKTDNLVKELTTGKSN